MNRMVASEEVHPDRIFTANLTYDFCGNKTSETDWYGNTTTFVYDDFNRLIETKFPAVRDADGNVVQPTLKKGYDAFGKIDSETDAEGYETRTQNTILGKPSEIFYPDGSQESFRYDLMGKTVEKKSRNGALTHYTYDSFGRLIQEETEGALIKKAEYSTFHKISETDPSGLKTIFIYDRAGRKQKEICGSRITEYEYDTLGRPICIRNNSLMIERDYDVKDQIQEERTYDLEGTLLGRVGYYYDSMGRKTHTLTYTDDGVNIDEKRFNSKGDLVYHQNAMGEVTATFYDYDYVNDLGQKVSGQVMVDPLGFTLETF